MQPRFCHFQHRVNPSRRDRRDTEECKAVTRSSYECDFQSYIVQIVSRAREAYGRRAYTHVTRDRAREHARLGASHTGAPCVHAPYPEG